MLIDPEGERDRLGADDLPLVLRRARSTDADAAAPLLYAATGTETAAAIWGLGTSGRALASYARLFARTGVLHSHDIATVAEVDGRVVGLILHAPWRVLAARQRATLWAYARVYGPLAALRLYPRLRHLIQASPSVPSSHYFVPYLAVLPEFQRRGVGRRLLETAHAAGWAVGASHCSLYVAIENQTAQSFYRRVGYHEQGRKTNAGLERLTGVSGRLHLVCGLGGSAVMAARNGARIDGDGVR